MKKSIDKPKKEIKPIDSEDLVVDYSKKVPKILDQIKKIEPDIIKKTAKISWDGRQFIVRIPTEIAVELKLSDEDSIEFEFIKPLPDSDDKPVLNMGIKYG